MSFITKKYIILFTATIILAGLTIYFVSVLINVPLKIREERFRIQQVKERSGIDESGHENLPLILGRRESCVKCHDEVKGLNQSHSPENIGCYSCHLGNRLEEDKIKAHAGMALIPGNTADLQNTCSKIECHPQMLLRMQNSIMNTMNGVVAVDKWAFGEAITPDIRIQVDSIKYSPAERHIRNLCASCHLSGVKNESGKINELSRGGGCLACHLNYSKEAETELVINSKEKKKNYFHPSIDRNVSDIHCFGCHSRSGRISLSYAGWYETLYKPEDIKAGKDFKVLEDGRVVAKFKADIHFEIGMECRDCHSSDEIMGDGSYALHKEDQIKAKCTNCHLSKESFSILFIKKQSPSCSEGRAHKDLSCSACHNSWSPQCIGCHTEYNKDGTMYDLLSNSEKEGEWIEHSSTFLLEPAVLGIKENIVNGIKERVVQEFIPGMIFTLDKGEGKKEFKRLYAPSFSHTIRRESRSCISCHNNPLALGYGRGQLKYTISGNKGKWEFIPAYPLLKEDGLPQDAWIGFMKEKGNNSTTRSNTRPFTINEQKKILTAGACLTCHEPTSIVMKRALHDFNKTISERNKKCIIPEWKF